MDWGDVKGYKLATRRCTSSEALIYAAAAKSLQSCPTLWDPIDGSPPGSPVPGILQARTLEWVAISFSNAWKWKVKGKSFSRSRLLATPWTTAFQAPLSMGFSRQEYWSGVPLPSPCFMYLESVTYNSIVIIVNHTILYTSLLRDSILNISITHTHRNDKYVTW